MPSFSHVLLMGVPWAARSRRARGLPGGSGAVREQLPARASEVTRAEPVPPRSLPPCGPAGAARGCGCRRRPRPGRSPACWGGRSSTCWARCPAASGRPQRPPRPSPACSAPPPRRCWCLCRRWVSQCRAALPDGGGLRAAALQISCSMWTNFRVFLEFCPSSLFLSPFFKREIRKGSVQKGRKCQKTRTYPSYKNLR